MTMVTGNYFLNCLRCRGQMVEDVDGFKCCQCGNIFFTTSLDYTPSGALMYMVPAMSYALHNPIKVMFVPVKSNTSHDGAIILETRAECAQCGIETIVQRKSRQSKGSDIRTLHFLCPNNHRFKIETYAHDPVSWTY